MRKGQVTIFVILGIVLVIIAVVALLIFKTYKSDFDEKIKKEAYQGQDFSNYMDYYIKTCMDEYSKKSAYDLVDNSFIDISKDKTMFVGLRKIPILLDGEVNNLMTINESQKYYAFIFDSYMIECVASMEKNSESDFSINWGIPRSNVEFQENLILIDLTFPITATNKDQTINKERFSYSLNYDLTKKHDLLNAITLKQLTTPNYFQIGFISEEAYKRSLPIEITYEGGPSKIKIIYNEDKQRKMEFIIK